MLKLRRLNLDSSWHIEWAGQSLLIDPWLLGSETDFSPLFNRQWHQNPPISIDEVPKHHAIIISQQFSDHCHEETLQQLDSKNIFTTKKVAQRIKKTITDTKVTLLPNLLDKEWVKLGDLELALFPAPKQLKASFNGIVIRYQEQLVIYCPHGYVLNQAQKMLIQQFKTQALITSFSTFQLPFYLGGLVNPGIQKAKQLVDACQPAFIFATHDEDKPSVGIVKKLAKTTYPSAQELSKHFSSQFVNLDNTKAIFEIL